MRVGFLFGLAVVLDQLTKVIVRSSMQLHESFNFIGEVIKITRVENPGIAFGIQVSNGTVFTVLSILASIGVLVYLITHWDESMFVKGSLALILGGAFGNLLDRIVYKEVTDFIDIGIGDLRWPVFNVADSAVVIGMVILLYTTFILEKKGREIPQEEIQKVE